MNLQQAIKTLATARAWIALSEWQHCKGKRSAANYAEHKGYILHCAVPDCLHTGADLFLTDNK